MLEELWHSIIEFSEAFIVPDWGALIALIPIGLGLLLALYLLWTVKRFATAGPVRRGVRRIEPVPPPGVHMPGPTFAPILAAVGAFLLFFGLIAGGISLWLGIIALVLTLLYWGREGLTDYDHLPDVAASGGTSTLLPAVVPQGPPPGVHMPGPSFRPILAAIGSTMLVLGLVLGGWALVAGIVVLVITLFGWLPDAGREYRAAVEADTTGHLDAGPPPAWPRTTFAVIGVLLVGSLVLGAGILGSGEGDGGEPGGSGAPPPSGEPGGSGAPPPSGEPLPDADVVIHALNIAFTEASVEAPADAPFTIAFDNQDAGVPHNVEIRDAGGATAFNGEIFNGVEARVYDVPALPAGSYTFVCSVHPNMTGTLTAG